MEDWRPVVGFDGYYEVSDQGRVRSLARHIRPTGRGRHAVRERMLKQTNAGRYNVVSLCKGGMQTRKYVHKLVAEAFLGACPEGMEVCHGPGGAYDNRLENLRYDTPSGNDSDKDRDGTRAVGRQHGRSKLTEEKVSLIRELAGTMSQAALGALIGVDQTTVSDVLRGKTWRHFQGTKV